MFDPRCALCGFGEPWTDADGWHVDICPACQPYALAMLPGVEVAPGPNHPDLRSADCGRRRGAPSGAGRPPAPFRLPPPEVPSGGA